MAATASWRELSDVQRQSWILVGPYLGAHLVVNIVLLIAYALGFTGALAGNNACHVIEAFNTGITDLHRALGGSASLDRICQLYVPASLVNILFAAILAGVVIHARGIRVVASKYFLPLIIFAFLPVAILMIDPPTSTTALDRSLRSGSIGAYIVFLLSSPLITSMLAVLSLQKIQKRS